MSRPRTSVERYGISSSSSTSMPSQKNTATKKPSSTNSKRQSSKKPSLIQELFLQLTNEIGINDSSDYIIPEDLIINQLSGPYKELESNNYRGKKSARRGIDNDDDEPLCACTSATGCTFEKCQNRLMMMECPIGCCPSILDGRHYCENTVIQRKAFPKTEVFYAQSCGLGLRLLEAVPRNAIIIEYLGDVITPEECEERMVDYEMKDNFYFASLDDGLLLDAKPAGSRARFANHCCDPTCELQKWMVLGEPRICIVSKRALAAGAEITYNYQYFNDGMDNTQHQGAGKRKKMKFKRQTCYCGAKNCAGTIGGKVMAADGGNDAWMRKAESMVSGRRKYTLEEVEANLSEYTGPDIELRELEAFGLVNDESSESKVLDSRDLCMALHQLVKRMKSWLEKHQLRLREMLQLSRFINTTEVDSILNQLPKAMKSPESIELEASQKRAMKAERVVRLLLGLPSTSIANNSAVTIENEESSESVAYAVIVDDPNLITSSSSSLFNQVTAPLAVNKLNQTKVSSSQLGSESTSSHRIDWSDLLSTLRDINQSLPVIVPYAQKFVPILQYLGNWSRPILAKAPISSAALATLRRSVESDSLAYRSIKKYVNAYLPIFNIDNSNTNANNASSRNHILENVSDISIYLDIFVLAAYLEGKLEDYINKKNKSKLSVKINQTPQIDPEVEVKTAGAVISKPNGRSSNTSAVIDEEDIVHCFCQQPENCAEIVTMKQCDGCDRWFHPNCVNDPLTRAAVKSRVQQDVSFQCPLCLLSSGQVGPFAAAPQSEWKISVHDAQTDEKTTGVPTKKAAPVVTITKEKSGGKSKIKVKRKTKAKANAIRSVTSTAQENLSPSKSTKRTSSQKNIPLESSAAASTRMRPPFKLSDLEVAIKSESQLKVCRVSSIIIITSAPITYVFYVCILI